MSFVSTKQNQGLVILDGKSLTFLNKHINLSGGHPNKRLLADLMRGMNIVYAWQIGASGSLGESSLTF
eukprot:3037562-Amphidinium_carterae.1